MSTPRYAYRLGWKTLRSVVRRSDLTVADYKALARDLGQAMVKHGITNRRRSIMFIAQVAHESGGFRYREEIASGQAYEGRRDLGNNHPGDGRRFKGRSYIQITGRSNYQAVGRALGVDFVSHPERLAEPRYAAQAAAWWWKTHGCSEIADTGNFVAVTRCINGGTNGLSDRLLYLARATPGAQFLIPQRRKP
jgi:predicted chitinase